MLLLKERKEKMEKEKKVKTHKILNHPILGYFLLALLVSLIASIFSEIIDDIILTAFIPGYAPAGAKPGSVAGIGAAVGTLIAMFIHKRHFRPDFQGCLVKENFLTGMKMVIPFVLLHVVGSIVSITICGVGNVGRALLLATAPGFMEEAMFRGVGISNYMRTIKDEKKIPVIFWLSSLAFGLIHIANIFAGADPFTSVIQGIYASGVGLLFGAIYLRTGNLWPTIIAHTIVDWAELCRADLGSTGGIMKGMILGDWITIAVGIAAGVLGVYLMRKEKRGEVMEVWNRRWNKKGEEQNIEPAVEA